MYKDLVIRFLKENIPYLQIYTLNFCMTTLIGILSKIQKNQKLTKDMSFC